MRDKDSILLENAYTNICENIKKRADYSEEEVAEMKQELENIYIAVGDNKVKIDDVFDRINYLEDMVGDDPYYKMRNNRDKKDDYDSSENDSNESFCGSGHCGGRRHCWDCAAIAGGDPMDV